MHGYEKMNLAKIEQVGFDCMASRQDSREREPGWLFYHGRRVARIALWLARELAIDIDQEVIFTGALFHDIGKGAEPHNEIGAAMTRESLKGLCTPGELDAISEIIVSHNQRGCSPHFSAVIRIVQDADVLDHVGSIGPWLAFYWSGTHNETFDDHIRFIQGEENATTQKRMRSGLNFEMSRRIFDERIEYEKRFFSEFKRVYLEGI